MKIDKILSQDFDDDQQVDVEWFPIPKGLEEAWEEVVREDLNKSLSKAGPYIGPKGGKWKDPQHTIPWKEKTDFKAGSKEHLLSLRNYLQENTGSSLVINQRNGNIVLSKIVVPKQERGSGKGSAIMKILLRYADTYSKTISLTPTSDFGGSKANLIKFYKRFNFVENKGRNKDYEINESMYRLPNVKKSLDLIEGAGNSRAGNRAPGPGSGVNYVIPVPKKEKDNTVKQRGYTPDIRKLLDEWAKLEDMAMRQDKEVYTFLANIRHVQTTKIDLDPIKGSKRENVEENKRYVTRYPVINAPRPKNKVDIN